MVFILLVKNVRASYPCLLVRIYGLKARAGLALGALSLNLPTLGSVRLACVYKGQDSSSSSLLLCGPDMTRPSFVHYNWPCYEHVAMALARSPG
jgi:hypothetical protein